MPFRGTWQRLQTHLVVTTGTGGWVLPASSGQRPEMLLNTLQCTAHLLRPLAAEHHAAHGTARNPRCADVRPPRPSPGFLGRKTLIPTACPLFRTLFELSFSPCHKWLLLFFVLIIKSLWAHCRQQQTARSRRLPLSHHREGGAVLAWASFPPVSLSISSPAPLLLRYFFFNIRS